MSPGVLFRLLGMATALARQLPLCGDVNAGSVRSIAVALSSPNRSPGKLVETRFTTRPGQLGGDLAGVARMCSVVPAAGGNGIGRQARAGAAT
jgi:hypothetical protein